MPEHIHILVTLLKDESIGDFMHILKSYTSRVIFDWCRENARDDYLEVFKSRGSVDGEKSSVWQRSFRSFPLDDEDAFLEKIE